MVYENCIHCEQKGELNKYYYCNAKNKGINIYDCTKCPLRIEKMSKNIAVGDYVRTKSGEVFKVKEVNPTIGGKIAIVRKENGFIRRVDLEEEKHSKNIIDIIEVGDFVNGEKVIEVHSDLGYVFVDRETELGTKTFCDYEIETILTKEQYLQNCYTVEREEKC